MTTQITAWFDSRDSADAALSALRRSGAAYSLSRISGHGGDGDMKLYTPATMSVGTPGAGGATLQLRVNGTDAALVRELIRGAGGREARF